MKKDIYMFRLSVLLLLFFAFACRKTLSPPVYQYLNLGRSDTSHQAPQTDSQTIQSIPFPQVPLTGCSYAPDYGDSIVFPQPFSGSNDDIISPINNPGPGTYLSWPQGLSINSSTGAIDLTKSEGGERFAIGFVKEGTTDTCLTTLIVGGAAYIDSVYVLANGATMADPYFNANPLLPSVCNTSNGSGGGCQFDVTGSAAGMKVVIDNNTGIIDLQKTLDGNGGLLSSGAFGLLPLNGQTISPVIYYRLNDGSNNALQHIQVTMMYYYSKSQMSGGLLNNILNKLDNTLLNLLILNSGNPRPPLVIITRFN
jgi:hypothetical protein